MIASLDVGMQALSISIKRKIPAVPRSPITLVAKSTTGWVREAVIGSSSGIDGSRPDHTPGGGQPGPARPRQEARRAAGQGSVTAGTIPLFDTSEQVATMR